MTIKIVLNVLGVIVNNCYIVFFSSTIQIEEDSIRNVVFRKIITRVLLSRPFMFPHRNLCNVKTFLLWKPQSTQDNHRVPSNVVNDKLFFVPFFRIITKDEETVEVHPEVAVGVTGEDSVGVDPLSSSFSFTTKLKSITSVS